MSSIKRRVEKIENKLNIGDKRTGVLIILSREGEELPEPIEDLPEPIEEWITYKEAKVKCGQVGIFLADPAAELEAREQQKATKGQGNE